MQLPSKDLHKFIVIGDKVLIQPKSPQEKTTSGLFLPPGVQEKEKLQSGYVLRVGPGYAIPSSEPDEPWKENAGQAKYVPLQAQEGDLAIYLQKATYQIEFEKQKYVVVPHSAILMIIRDEELFT